LAPICFVIQKFDRGKYDKRYRDVFEPAIRAAGYEPYRVDHDPAASIPIDEIERKIRLSDVCFAEITEDNPNVWFELGFALASQKEVCLVCSNERTTKYPFDIQHRLIINYSTDSTSDYHEMHEKIRQRLAALSTKQKTFAALTQDVVLRPRDGLTDHEFTCLCVIMQNRHDPGDKVPNSHIVKDMEGLGYTKLASQIALHKLLKKDYIESEVQEHYDSMNNESYNVTLFSLTNIGIEFLIDNESQLQLFKPNNQKNAVKSRASDDDDIPF
jgi:hypothetical protein